MKKKFVIVCLVGLLAIPIIANGVTMTQTDSFTDQVLDYTRVSTFNKFDTMGGTRVLNSVTIKVDFQITSGNFIVDNDAAQSAVVDYTYSVTGNLTSADVFISPAVGLNISDTIEDLPLAANVGDTVGNIDGSSPDGALIAPDTALYTASQIMSAPAMFLGTGTFNTSFATGRTFQITGASGLEGGYTAMLTDGAISVTYDYTVVPEPATLALLGLGGLMIRRRRR